MFSSRRISTLSTEDTQYLTRLDGLKKTVVVKKNGDFNIYTDEGLHTYKNLLEGPIFKICDSNLLSTLFVQVENAILLLKAGNMARYDRIVDRRGIIDCWCLEEGHDAQLNERRTILMVQLKTKVPSVKFYVWEELKFIQWKEVSLSWKDELINSFRLINQCVLFTTNKATYSWKIGDSEIERLETITLNKFPPSLIELIEMLDDCVEESAKKDADSLTDSFAKLYSGTLWNSQRKKKLSGNISTIFQPSSNQFFILDGRSEELLEININDGDLMLKAYDHRAFFQRNNNFTRCKHFWSEFLILYGERDIQIVDYKTGFSYFELTSETDIKDVFQLNDTELMIWKDDDVLEFYRINIDDKAEFGWKTIQEAITETNIKTLERRIIFFEVILKYSIPNDLSPREENPEILQEHAMKLREIYSVFCLHIYQRAQKVVESVGDNLNTNIILLHEKIMRRIFELFLKFIVSPELVILYCFPSNISNTINCLCRRHTNLISELPLSLNSNVVKTSLIPYLTEVRRHLRNIKCGRTTYWEYNTAKIELSLNFFQNGDNDDSSINELLALIDTATFMSYLKYNRAMVEYFVRVDNSCDFSIVEKSLKEEKMIHELIDFYFTRRKHRKAFSLLSELMETSAELRDNIKSLIIDYLRKLGPDNIQMIFEYSDILLNNFPDDMYGILTPIFLHPSTATLALPYQKVYDYLQTKGMDLSLSYLEFVIGERKHADSNLFCTLIKRYLPHINESNFFLKLRAVLSVDVKYDPKPVLRIIRTALQEEKNDNGSNIKKLKQLQVYPLKKMGEHEASLNILWSELSDYKLCSEYCHSVYLHDPSTGKEVLMTFLRKIVNIDDVKMKAKLLQVFLAENGSKLIIEEVLKSISVDVPLTNLANFFSTELKKLSNCHASMHIHRNILESNLTKINYDLSSSVSEFQILTEERKCPVCNKILVTQAIDSVSVISYRGKSYATHVPCAKKLQTKIEMERASFNIRSGPVLSDYI